MNANTAHRDLDRIIGRLELGQIVPIGMGEPPRDVQGTPYVDRRNLQNLRAALDNVPHEILADAIADALIRRFGKVRASFIGRDIARIAETGK